MGRMGNSTKRIPNSGSAFVKFKDGEKFRFRLLQEPYVQVTQYGTDDPSYAYIFQVWDYTEEKVRLLSQTPAGVKIIDEMNEEWGGEVYPSNFDLTVSATGSGSGQGGRKYTRTSSPQRGTMPPSNTLEMVDMAKLAPGAISLTEFESGADPELQLRDDQSEPQASTILPSGETVSTDTTPNDVPEGDIDLSKIPF